MMEYKGYVGQVEYDDASEVFHGEIINIRDVVTFSGKSVKELQRAFRESIEDYLAFCIERNELPDKPFSGTFTVRLQPEQHRAIYTKARSENKSLNAWVTDLFVTAAQNPSNGTLRETPTVKYDARKRIKKS